MLVGWLIPALLTLPFVVFAVLSWKNRYWQTAARIHYSPVAAASVAFVWFLNYWNLIGFRY